MTKILIIELSPQLTLIPLRNPYFEKTFIIVENLADAFDRIGQERFDAIYISRATEESKSSEVQATLENARLVSACQDFQVANEILDELGFQGISLDQAAKPYESQLTNDLDCKSHVDQQVQLAQTAVDLALQGIEKADSTGKHLVANLPNVFQYVANQLQLKDSPSLSLACHLLPLGFSVSPPDEIDCIRVLDVRSDAFHLVMRKTFLAAARLTEKLQILAPVSQLFQQSAFVGTGMYCNEPQDLRAALYASTIYSICQAIGLDDITCHKYLKAALPKIDRKLKTVFREIPEFRCRESIVPLSRLQTGTVLKQELRFKAGALLLPPDSRITQEIFSSIAKEIQQNSTKNVLVALDSLCETDQKCFKEVFYIDPLKKGAYHTQCEIISREEDGNSVVF